MLQNDFKAVFDYVEPDDRNLQTYSHRMQQLLMRLCVEVEANFRAILVENAFAGPDASLSMHDYALVERSHRLSSYSVEIPDWTGAHSIRKPFQAWCDEGSRLPWYFAYNKTKHDRHLNLPMATFEAMTEAMCGLVALLAAQFHHEDYSPADAHLSLGQGYSYGARAGYESAIGGYFRISYPADWPQDDKYDFEWDEIATLEDPFENFDYSARP